MIHREDSFYRISDDLSLTKEERYRKGCFHKDKRLYEYTFKNDDGKDPVMKKIRKYAYSLDKNSLGLLLWGNSGNGKTFAAACIANSRMTECEPIPVLMTSFGFIINRIFSEPNKDELIENIVSYPLLIIDDLGAERQSEYTQEIIYNIVDARYKTGRPLIVTTNLTLDQIQNPTDLRYVRIYDRLLEMCVPVHFKGISRRKAISEQNRDIMKALFDEVEQ